jgi:hypothetical protein
MTINHDASEAEAEPFAGGPESEQLGPRHGSDFRTIRWWAASLGVGRITSPMSVRVSHDD